MSYLVVDLRDGSILCELDALEDALSLLGAPREAELRDGDLAVLRVDDRSGEIVGTASVLTMRPMSW